LPERGSRAALHVWPRWLRPNLAARYLGMSEGALRQVPGRFKVDGKAYYDQADLDAFMAARKGDRQAAPAGNLAKLLDAWEAGK
jgi:hypothetical protein